MQAPSAVGFTVKQRLMMFWQHKRPLVICVASVILAAILIVALFTFAQIKTLYARFTGESSQTTTTQVTNIYTISSGTDGTTNTTNNTIGVQGNTTIPGNSTTNGTNITTNNTMPVNQTTANTSVSVTNTTQNSTLSSNKTSTNQTNSNTSLSNNQNVSTTSNSTNLIKHRHHQFLHKSTFQNIKQHFLSYRHQIH